MSFDTKQGARQHVWRCLKEEGVARFPFPVEGRIPNFSGKERAAERLFEGGLTDGVRRMKINPDSPQKPVRRLALERGIEVYMPTPRLRGGFMRLDPRDIPSEHYGDAVALSHVREWCEEVPLEGLPEIDLIVAGSVAVTRDGLRCGKGEGYSDLEYAILRELGHPAVKVVTTVHPLQIVDGFPRDDHDTPIASIVTADEIIEVDDPPEPPEGIDWNLLTEEDLEEMLVLRELRGAGRSD